MAVITNGDATDNDNGADSDADAGHPAGDDDGGSDRCTICLCGSSDGALLQRGCCCRGESGLVHLGCIAQLAVHAASQENGSDCSKWSECGTCKQRLTGEVLIGLAEAWWARARSRPEDDIGRLHAAGNLADAQREHGR